MSCRTPPVPSNRRDRRLGLTGKFIALTSGAVLATSLGVVTFAIWQGSKNTHEASDDQVDNGVEGVLLQVVDHDFLHVRLEVVDDVP